jgi:hypothetical protein
VYNLYYSGSHLSDAGSSLSGEKPANGMPQNGDDPNANNNNNNNKLVWKRPKLFNNLESSCDIDVNDDKDVIKPGKRSSSVRSDVTDAAKMPVFITQMSNLEVKQTSCIFYIHYWAIK